MQMKRLNHLLAAVVLLMVATAGNADHHKATRPNIVVFLVDDMGLMDTSVPFMTDANGKPEVHPLNKFYRTPSMARLAKQGIRFSQFYANSVCSPTRVSIMTGQSSARHHTTQYIKPESNNRGGFGPKDWQWKGISAKHVTLAALLEKSGYRTIHAGKGHFGPVGSFGAMPDNFGFNVNIAGCAYGQPGSYYGLQDFGHKNRKSRAVPGLKQYHGKDIFLTEALTLEMNKEISASVKAKKPFFAYMSHYAVHAPFNADKRFTENYKKTPKGAAGTTNAKGKGKGKGKGKSNNAIAFATLIEGMDKSLGDMLDHLEKLGVAENTLVFFLGDNGTDAPLGSTHGIACSAPLRGKKGTHYEGGMRVPFIAAWAKPNGANAIQNRLQIPHGLVMQDVGRIYDLFPTILAMAEIDPHKAAGKKLALDGKDLSFLLAGKPDPVGVAPRDFLMHFPHSHRSSYFTSYRKGDLKLVYHYQRSTDKRYELFDLAKDRDESNNLAATQPKVLREMVTAMAKKLEEAGAQYVLDKAGNAVKPVLP